MPGLPEQRAIVDFLDRETAKIDALVARKERLIELLQEKRTALITRTVTRYGAAQEQFNVAHAVEFFVPLAPQAEQRAVAAFLDRATARIDALTNRIQTAVDHLDEFRTALISAAVTGKIDVREAVPR